MRNRVLLFLHTLLKMYWNIFYIFLPFILKPVHFTFCCIMRVPVILMIFRLPIAISSLNEFWNSCIGHIRSRNFVLWLLKLEIFVCFVFCRILNSTALTFTSTFTFFSPFYYWLTFSHMTFTHIWLFLIWAL